jgi:hypothetical protein
LKLITSISEINFKKMYLVNPCGSDMNKFSAPDIILWYVAFHWPSYRVSDPVDPNLHLTLRGNVLLETLIVAQLFKKVTALLQQQKIN